ncbi:hypothetical protein HDU67_003730 [Dinochytrium kinnereticum]|nr:hypothetical protein HDU67_003730 [Dinochytrium kinnereticum]
MADEDDHPKAATPDASGDEADDREDESTPTSNTLASTTPSDPTVKKKKKKKKKKKSTDASEDGPEAPLPKPKKPPVVFIDDPNWVMTTVPAGWSTDVPGPSRPPAEEGGSGWNSQPPSGWDDTPVRAMLQHAIRREEMLRQRMAAAGGAPLPANPTTNIHATFSHDAAAAVAQGGNTTWAASSGPPHIIVPDDIEIESSITELD